MCQHLDWRWTGISGPKANRGHYLPSPLQGNCYQSSPAFHKWMPQLPLAPGRQPLGREELHLDPPVACLHTWNLAVASCSRHTRKLGPCPGGWKFLQEILAKGACLFCLWNAINKPSVGRRLGWTQHKVQPWVPSWRLLPTQGSLQFSSPPTLKKAQQYFKGHSSVDVGWGSYT